jgi:DNA topoisomerase-1
MTDTLVIVESPAKAKTIAKYLGKGYQVRASVGHVVDLPRKDLGVDLAHDFAPTYEVMPEKKKVVAELIKAAKGVKEIILAPDPDREGEAIAWHIADLLGGKDKQIRRMLINEITKTGVQQALASAGELNRDLFDAQQARRILDRLVGYQISPLLYRTLRRPLSAGRVQSVAVRLVVDRENEIRAFKTCEYWTVEAELAAALPPNFKARLIELSGKKVEAGPVDPKDPKKTYLPDENSARAVVSAVREIGRAHV